MDDVAGMKPNHKSAVQSAAAMLMPFCGLLVDDFYGLFGLHEPPLWFGCPFAVFVILLVVDSMNLIDGLAYGLRLCILAECVSLYMRMECTFVYALAASGLSGSLSAFFCSDMWGKAE